jgi:Bacterial PH domain
MNDDLYFAAPWSKALKNTSIFATLILVFAAGTTIASTAKVLPPLVFGLTCLLFPAILLICIPYGVRGYTLRGQTLILHRIGWSHSVDLSTLSSVAFDPSAVKGAIKAAGNGGLFSISGFFNSPALGMFRAAATDMSLAVVLKFPKWTLVITPERPDEFENAVNSAVFGGARS